MGYKELQIIKQMPRCIEGKVEDAQGTSYFLDANGYRHWWKTQSETRLPAFVLQSQISSQHFHDKNCLEKGTRSIMTSSNTMSVLFMPS